MRAYIYSAIAFIIILTGIWWANGARSNSSSEKALPRQIDFNFHIRPILVQKCYLCHGPDPSGRKADLRLDTFEGATAFLKDSSRAIVPGDLEHSALIGRINNEDPELVMPPPESKQLLSKREIDLLTKWIKQGAKWKPHWALIPPKPVEPDGDFKNPIDFFIQEKLDEHGLSAGPAAGKNSLIRRVSYLLTGLPPTPEEVEFFLRDESAGAYEKMVNQYLSSNGFGERWARHWMDVVRYAETKGHEFDYAIAGAWIYRDYLIRAFNNDVPYDQLVEEHLAGDLLATPRRNPETGVNESHIGTAFYTFTEGSHSPVDVRQDEVDRIDNMIDVTTKSFQALTVSCARCHDHKFDPIKTADYYGLFGVMESTRFSPVPVQLTLEKEHSVEEIEKTKTDIRKMIADQWAPVAEKADDKRTFSFVTANHHQRETMNDKIRVLGDFRGNTLAGWKSDGLAFGKSTTLGKPLFSPKTKELIGLSDGKASSRIISTGIFGALRSPDFVIDSDLIGVRALGNKATIRIIIDNFQLISYPIYGGMDQKVNTADWKNFQFDVAMWKGHKAYIEILPGSFNQHVYQLPPGAFVEVQYAIAFNGKWSEPVKNFPVHSDRVSEAIENWVRHQSTPAEIDLLNRLLRERVFKNSFSELAGMPDTGNLSSGPPDTSAFYNGVYDGFGRNSPVFVRGSYKDPSPKVVPRKFLSAIAISDSIFVSPGSGRLELAASILDEQNPLTARVMANRIWHHVFGRGIVETVDNFGLQGKLPTHPELLDFLATKFREDSWSIKKMVKFMMMSETFQRGVHAEPGTEKEDPDNLFLARYPVRRIEAEAIRDGVLAASGELKREMYGPPVPAYVTDFMQGRGRPKNSGPLDGNGRRSIYQEVRRNFMQPMMTAFDHPIPFSSFGKRDVTNVPAQSLILMNDPFVHLQAESMARNLIAQKELTLEERFQWVYTRALSRPVSQSEINQSKTFILHLAKLNGTGESEIANDVSIWKDYCHSIFNLKEFIYLI